jgi:L-ascorbate metabolism protein UlaG (beta-lactamase superfamily)
MANATLTWLGHASFRLDTPGGKRVYVDPWLENPRCPAAEREPERADVVALTHGHADHVGSAVELGARFRPRLVAIVELARWLESQGFPEASSGGMNKGGTADVDGIRFTLTNAFHSSSTPDGRYAGEPCGIVIQLESGLSVYVAGDTCVFGDMQLIGRIYRPDVAILPIGDWYTMGPREAAVALELLGVGRCVPCHWGTFPVLSGTPAALRALAPDVEIVDVVPGEPLEL